MITLKDIEDGERISGTIPKSIWYSHHCRMGTATTCWCKCVGTSPDPKHELMDSIIASGSTDRKTAEFIAHHNPSYMLSLYEQIRVMREALESIASQHKPRHDTAEYWLGINHEQCAEVLETDTKIARQALERIK